MRVQPVENQWGKKGAGGITFQRIHQQHKNPRRFAQHAHRIGRADVPAAHAANVYPLRLRDEIAKRNRAEQIRAERDQDVTQNCHSANLTVAGCRLKVESLIWASERPLIVARASRL